MTTACDARRDDMDRDDKVYVAGHRGLVGSALVRALNAAGHTRILTRTHAELDLTRQADVERFFHREQPRYVLLAAAKVGGIHANNTYRAEFIFENLMLQTNVLHAAHRNGVERLLFLGSSCVYPRDCPQPMREEHLLTGPLEPTNAPYAVAKIAGLTMCAAYNDQYGTSFVAVMPTNLYGPNDNFDLDNAHVLAALLRKAHEAKLCGARSVEVWGSGAPRREFLHVDDLAAACLYLMDREETLPLTNVGSGEEITIRRLAELISQIVGFDGELVFDAQRPDGAPRKLLDSSRLRRLGWAPTISLRDGIAMTYEWYRRWAATPSAAAVRASE